MRAPAIQETLGSTMTACSLCAFNESGPDTSLQKRGVRVRAVDGWLCSMVDAGKRVRGPCRLQAP